MRVCNVAAEWRNRYHKDVVIDLICYRRHGHNEMDEPMLTQPRVYKVIKSHTPVVERYAKSLMDSEVVSLNEYKVCVYVDCVTLINPIHPIAPV